VVQNDGQRRYDDGYRDGRAACLRAGSSSSAREWLADNDGLDPAYVAGYEWALWDYDDANGLPPDTAGQRRRAGGPVSGRGSNHPPRRVEKNQLGWMELVLDDERPVLDPPQTLPGAESREQ
jgi:hypothetical protein